MQALERTDDSGLVVSGELYMKIVHAAGVANRHRWGAGSNAAGDSPASFPYRLGLLLMDDNTQGGEARCEPTTPRWWADPGFGDIQVVVASPISSDVSATD
jgi:hypothetical protein